MSERKRGPSEKRDEAYYERVRELLDEDAIANRRLGWDVPLSKKYQADPLLTARARTVRRPKEGPP